MRRLSLLFVPFCNFVTIPLRFRCYALDDLNGFSEDTANSLRRPEKAGRAPRRSEPVGPSFVQAMAEKAAQMSSKISISSGGNRTALIRALFPQKDI